MTEPARVNTPTITETPAPAYTPPWRDLIDQIEGAHDAFVNVAQELEELLDALADQDEAPDRVQDAASDASYVCSSAVADTARRLEVLGVAVNCDDGTDPDSDDLLTVTTNANLARGSVV
jgi:hypothetical protein